MNLSIKEVSTKLFNYLGLEEIEIKYEEIPDDSRFYSKDLYIGISTKYIDDKLESLKCIIHEIRHYYQLIVVAYGIDMEPQYSEWVKELKMDINKLKPEDSMCLYIEVDAYAFTKYILKEWFNYTISEVTKMDITDLLINGMDIQEFFQTKRIHFSWHGRITEIDFIKRICDVSKIPVDDKRCKSFEDEYLKHRQYNDDYDNDFFFKMEKLPYKKSNTATFLKIICEMFHPEVRNENGWWKDFKNEISKLIKNDGFEFYVTGYISGREVFGVRKITFLDDNKNVNIANLKEVSKEINSEYIYQQIKLMEESQKDNPTESIGKSKELLETICKTILKRLNKDYEESWEIQTLTAKTYKALKLSPDDVKDGPLSQTVKQILGGLNSVSGGLASLRNSYGSGHGKDENYKGLPERYAKLAIGSVSTLVVFLWDTMLYQLNKS